MICQNDTHTTEPKKFPFDEVDFVENTKKSLWKGLWSSFRFFDIRCEDLILVDTPSLEILGFEQIWVDYTFMIDAQKLK